MIEGLEISEDRLGAWLERHVTGFSAIHGVRKFATGQSNPTYLIEAASGRYVLRAKPPGQLLKSAHQVDREYRMMTALADSPVPVPRTFCLAEAADSPFGRAFFVMAHLEGRIFWDPALADLGKAARGPIYDAMNATLAALHEVRPDTVGLGDFGRPGNYFARQAERWSGQYRASVRTPLPDLERVMDWLADNLPDEDGQEALVHGDFRLDNMIFDPQVPRVIGLLDWELSTLGHPLADLAYQCAQWRLPHDGGMRGLGGLDRRALGLPSEADYVAAYLARRGLGPIRDWPFYLAFSLFRIAAILQGVVRRAEDGTASNPESALNYAGSIPVLAKMAVEIIDCAPAPRGARH